MVAVIRKQSGFGRPAQSHGNDGWLAANEVTMHYARALWCVKPFRSRLTKPKEKAAEGGLLSGCERDLASAIRHEADPGESQDHHGPSGGFGNGSDSGGSNV